MALQRGNSSQTVKPLLEKPHKLPTHKFYNSSSFNLPNTWAIKEKISSGHTHTNPNCTLCQINGADTWPHLLSLCNNKFLKGLRIIRHNVIAHQLTNLIKSYVITRHLTLIDASIQQGNHQDNTIAPWTLSLVPKLMTPWEGHSNVVALLLWLLTNTCLLLFFTNLQTSRNLSCVKVNSMIWMVRSGVGINGPFCSYATPWM